MTVAKKIADSKVSSKSKMNELFALDVNVMAKLHLIAVCYERARKNIERRGVSDPNFKSLLLTVMANFALNSIKQDCTALFEAGYFGLGSKDLIEGAYKQTLTDLRPQIVPIAELLPDSSTPSTIGNEYGDIYELQYETAKSSRLN